MHEPASGLDLEIRDIDDAEGADQSEYEKIIKEIIELERQYFFEKRNVKTERQRRLRDIIERHVPPGGQGDDT